MARKKRHEEHENHERWLVSYADFITLLFAFFTVLYATSQADLKKQGEFEESFKKSISGGGLGGNGQENGEMASKANSPFRTSHQDDFPPLNAGPNEVQDHVERRVDNELTEPADQNLVTDIRHDAVGVRIQLAAAKIFLSGSADLINGATSSLDKLGAILRDSKRKIIVEGHTDDEPIRTSRFPSNWDLSAARATKIVRYLNSRGKIPASRFTVVAYADQRPAHPNTSEENRAKNRRIEILLGGAGP